MSLEGMMKLLDSPGARSTFYPYIEKRVTLNRVLDNAGLMYIRKNVIGEFRNVNSDVTNPYKIQQSLSLTNNFVLAVILEYINISNWMSF